MRRILLILLVLKSLVAWPQCPSFERGARLFHEGEYSRAIENFLRSIREDCYVHDCYLYMGEAHLIKKNYIDAQNNFSEAISYGSQNDCAYFKRAISESCLGELNQAIIDLKEAIRLNPHDRYYSYKLAKLCQKAGRWEDAIQNYSTYLEKAIPGFAKGSSDELCSQHPRVNTSEVHERKAECLWKMGRIYDADAEYRQFDAAWEQENIKPVSRTRDSVRNRIEKCRTEAPIWLLKGKEFFYCDTSYAIAYIDSALKLYPYYVQALAIKGAIEIAKKNYKTALAYFNRIPSSEKTDTVYCCEGYCYLQMNDYEHAVDCFTHSTKAKNGNQYQDPFKLRGDAQLSQKKYEEAILDYDKVIELNRTNKIAFYDRGFAKFYQGDYNGAISDLTNAIDLDPTFVRAYKLRSNAYQRKGESQKAKSDNAKYQDFMRNPIEIRWQKPLRLYEWSDRNEISVPNGRLNLSVEIRNSTQPKITDISVMLNGKPISQHAKSEERLFGQEKYPYSFSVDVPEGITSSIYVQYGNRRSPDLLVKYNSMQMNLHLLVIAPIYKGKDTLKYNIKDARDILKAFTTQQGENRLYRHIFLDSLIGASATKKAFREKIRNLGYFNLKKNDLIIIFFSGHGRAGDNQSQLVLADGLINTHDMLVTPVENASQYCKSLILLDACHSGNTNSISLPAPTTGVKNTSYIGEDSFYDALVRSFAVADANVINSCGRNEKSYEDICWQNGAFTKAILDGLLKGEADGDGLNSSKNGIITLGELYKYLPSKVFMLIRNCSSLKGEPSVIQTPGILHEPTGELSIFEYTK